MKKTALKLLVVFIAAITLFAFTACSGDNGGEQSSSDPMSISDSQSKPTDGSSRQDPSSEPAGDQSGSSDTSDSSSRQDPSSDPDDSSSGSGDSSSEQEKTFTIVWKVGDEILKTDTVRDGDMPVYDGETPVKEADAQYAYSHSGWSPEIVVATEDAEYEATFDTTIRTSAVVWKDEDGTV